ncbi:hypothetical protein ACFOZ7_05675 [Natribaculum luteum]|uniref:DUF389 domain-containing protein n=1 Tax=Natribaculum luteum TaxID=1586232 RepID=A0ABD5NWN7_9EURY|nr:hypothetical protein [Natribaculum luteum]
MSNDLFDGTETSIHDPSDVSEDDRVLSSDVVDGDLIKPEQMAIDAIKRTLTHLTYRELHAFGAGFVPLFLGLVLGFNALIALSVPLAIVAVGCVRCTPIVGGRVAKWTIKQPQYLFLGQFVATFTGGLVVAIIRVVGFTAGLVA